MKRVTLLFAFVLCFTVGSLRGQERSQAAALKKGYDPQAVRAAVPMEPVPAEVRAQFLRPGELMAIQEKFPVAFQPVGTLEWHGRQNPIGCDAIKADRLCQEVARRAGGVVMPAIYFAADAYRDTGKGYGLGMDTEAGFELPGSFYQIDYDLFKRFMVNCSRNYLNRGFKLVVIVSGHNPQIQQNVLDEVCFELKTPENREPVFFAMEFTGIARGNPRRGSDHAGGYETSMMLFLNGDRVNMKANDGQAIPKLAIYEAFPIEKANAEEGRIRFELQVEGMVQMVRERLARLP